MGVRICSVIAGTCQQWLRGEPSVACDRQGPNSRIGYLRGDAIVPVLLDVINAKKDLGISGREAVQTKKFGLGRGVVDEGESR